MWTHEYKAFGPGGNLMGNANIRPWNVFCPWAMVKKDRKSLPGKANEAPAKWGEKEETAPISGTDFFGPPREKQHLRRFQAAGREDEWQRIRFCSILHFPFMPSLFLEVIRFPPERHISASITPAVACPEHVPLPPSSGGPRKEERPSQRCHTCI